MFSLFEFGEFEVLYFSYSGSRDMHILISNDGHIYDIRIDFFSRVFKIDKIK